MKLSKKLILNFVSLIIVSIIVISLISNAMINNRFEGYLINEREIKFQRISREINELYSNNNSKLDGMELMHYALAEDINIIIEDLEGNVLYNTNTRGNMGMMGNMHHRGRGMMMQAAPGSYVEKNYPLVHQGEKVANLLIGYIDNDYLTESAMIFKSTLFKSFLISGFIAILAGLLFSIILSKRLTTPLLDIRNTANKIQAGNLNAQAKVKTDIIEIQELSQSLNYLSNTLNQQEAIRRRYASDISHELRTPLTTLKTHLEAIMDGVWKANSEHLQILMDETERLSNLVENLKDSFVEEEYKLELNKSNFDISKEISNIITTFTPVYKQNNYIIKAQLDPNVKVYMDRDKFIQIMNNLLSNSLRYLDHNGQVSISLHKNNNHSILLEIEDNGRGIKEENLAFIFERFYRVDTSRDKSTGGTGLGLSIVKSIVEAHNGSIKVTSLYGRGTKFTIEFPIKI